MTTKKSNTAKPKAKSTPTAPRVIAADDLPELLAAVLTHPQLPPYLWEHFTDAILEVGSDVEILESADYIRAVLNLGKRRKRGGGR
jgi:hypothetical protein